MKNAFAVVVAVVLVLGAIPAFAGDGYVPQATLSALGLGGMEVVSDSEGMQVRGMSSNAAASSLSFINAFLFDPTTAANFTFNAADWARATDENAGLNASSSAEVNTLAGVAEIFVEIEVNGHDVYQADISTLGVTGNAAAVVPAFCW
jgi:hypothetical protein